MLSASNDCTYVTTSNHTHRCAAEFVSSKHIEISWTDGSWFVLDLDSGNGTKLNDSQVRMMAGEQQQGHTRLSLALSSASNQEGLLLIGGHWSGGLYSKVACRVYIYLQLCILYAPLQLAMHYI